MYVRDPRRIHTATDHLNLLNLAHALDEALDGITNVESRRIIIECKQRIIADAHRLRDAA